MLKQKTPDANSGATPSAELEENDLGDAADRARARLAAADVKAKAEEDRKKQVERDRAAQERYERSRPRSSCCGCCGSY